MSEAEWKEMFTMIDETGTGTIPISKFGLCMRALKTYPSEAEVEAYIKEADPKNKGIIDFDTFAKFMKKEARKGIDFNACVDAFRVFDREGDGTVSATEMKHVLVSMGEKLTQEEAFDFVNDADLDKDGCFNYKDYLKQIIDE